MDVYLSPPFSNWLRWPNTTPIVGTYTWNQRPGAVWQAIQTFRPTPLGWSNQQGLRNPGVERLPHHPDWVYSIAAIEEPEWEYFHNRLEPWRKLELNLSCPNHATAAISDGLVKRYVDKYLWLQVKLGAMATPQQVQHLYDLGVRRFHLCNTVPSSQGALSGAIVKKHALPLIRRVRMLGLDHLQIVGGGGIYTPNSVIDYYQAGADHVSLSTVWCSKPWWIPLIVSQAHRLHQ